MKYLKALTTVFMTLLLLMVFSGCGLEEAGTEDPSNLPSEQNEVVERSQDPVTIQLASSGSSTVVDEPFQELTHEFLQKNYPHITLNFNPPSGETTIENMIVAGTPPDIIVTYNGNLGQYSEMKLLIDMSEMFDKHNIDLNRFESNYIEDVRNASEDGTLSGLPINANFHAMYYNKDIFDAFGAPYPEDGMTWDDVLQLAAKVSRQDGETNFRGLDPGNGPIWMSQPLSIAAIDPETDEPTINTDTWQRVFRLGKQIYEIPGNGAEIANSTPRSQFVNEKTLAILLDLNYFDRLEQAANEGLVWDVAQYPSYPEQPNTYGNASVYVMAATSTTNHLDAVTMVMDTITSEQFQLELSKIGRLSVLQSEDVKQAFGEGLESLSDKNLPGIFKSTPVPYPLASDYRSQAEGIVKKIFNEYVSGIIDVNTALSRAEEEIKVMVAEMKGES